MEMWERITRARKEVDGLSQSELARQLGLKPQSVQQWEKPKSEGGTEPRPARLSAIAQITGVSYVWLATGEGPMKGDGVGESAPSYGLEPAPAPRSVPVLSWEQAGDLNKAFTGIERRAIQPEERTTTRAVSARAFVLVVRGNAMQSSAPGAFSFTEGMELLVDPDVTAAHGSFVIAAMNGLDTPIFRRLEVEGGIKRLQALADGYRPMEMDESRGDRIIGKVVEYRGALP